MKKFIETLDKQIKDLANECEKLHLPFAGMIEDPDPYGVYEDERNRDYAQDELI